MVSSFVPCNTELLLTLNVLRHGFAGTITIKTNIARDISINDTNMTVTYVNEAIRSARRNYVHASGGQLLGAIN